VSARFAGCGHTKRAAIEPAGSTAGEIQLQRKRHDFCNQPCPGRSPELVGHDPQFLELAGQLAAAIDTSGSRHIVFDVCPGVLTIALIMTTNAFTTNPWLYPNIPINAEEDFVSITLEGPAPNLLAVHPPMPATTGKEPVALARSRNGPTS
jgi:hypothetical protein